MGANPAFKVRWAFFDEFIKCDSLNEKLLLYLAFSM